MDPLTTEQPQGCADATRSLSASRARAAMGLEALRERVYGLSDLSRYSLLDRLMIRATGLFFYCSLGLICSTLRWEIRGREHLDSILAAGHLPIFTVWHMCIVSSTWFWRQRGIVVMSSFSRDAEYTGRVIKRFGYGAARGSSTRGGAPALAEMARCMESGMEGGLTIDGPRGPAFVAKPGAVTLARHTGQAILPFHTVARRCIQLRSWDGLQIPIPFSLALTLVAEPIYVPRDSSNEELTAKQEALQSALDTLRREAEDWRAKGKGQRAKG